MKNVQKYFVVILSLIFVFSTLPVSAPAFSNTGFNSWTGTNLDDWKNNTINGGLVQESVFRKFNVSGEFSVKFLPNGNPGSDISINQTFDTGITNGVDYTFSVWVFDNVPNSDMQINLTIGANQATAKTTGSNSNWQELIVSVIADGITANVNISIIELTAFSEDLYADDVRFTPTVSEFPTQSLLLVIPAFAIIALVLIRKKR